VKERSTSYGRAKMRDFQLVQLRVAAAGARIDAARGLVRADCLEAAEIAKRGIIADAETKLRFKRNLAYAAQLCTEAVDTLHSLAGANGIYEAYPLERIFRDAHALGGHIMHNFDTQGSAWGYAALGGVVNNPTL
jgi:3-hydroxy-9,10-secoandrosta-1,3,5(10)-triene-9,17-dione monooxygenase